MSKTILCVLLKVLMLARADILSMDPNSDFIQNFDRSQAKSVSVRNNIDEITFANMSVIPKLNKEYILSKPTSPRTFVEFHNGFLNAENNISVTFRWSQPEFTDKVIGQVQGYTVQYCFIENQKEIQICDHKSISATILECTVHSLKSNTTYYFQVRAHTKVGAGPYTDLINASTMHENPMPQLLIITENGIDIWDLDLKSNVNLVKDENVKSVTHLIAEHKIYWSNGKTELMMLEINKNIITKIVKLKNIARYLCIDWVVRNLYWIEIDEYDIDYIIKLDLTMWENSKVVKYDKILKLGTYFTGLILQPSTGRLYLTNSTMDRKPQIIQSDFDGNNARIIQNNLSIICLSSPFSFNMSNLVDMKIDDMNSKNALIYWLLNNLLIVTDINISICNLIVQNEKINYSQKIYFKSLAIDKTNIYVLSSNHYIYILEKKYAFLESVDAFKYIQKIEAPSWHHEFYAFGKSLQSYPPMRCLTPEIYNVEKPMYTTNKIIVNLPEPVLKNGCKKHNLPTTLLTFKLQYCLDNEFNKSNTFILKYERYYEIQDLMPLTMHKLLLVISNFYSDQLSMGPLFSLEVKQKTKPGKFEAPENVTVEALTPTIAEVDWTPSKKLNCVPVIYEVYCTLITNSTQQINKLLINKIERKEDSKFFTRIEQLIPGQKYTVFVRIYPTNFSDHYNDSLNKTLEMYSEPNNITLNEVSINGMNISWIPSVNMVYYLLEYKNIEMQEWQIVRQNNFEPNNEGKIMYYIKNLLPRTRYEFRLILQYPRYTKNFIWPSDRRFTFSTLTNISRIYSVDTQYYQYIISSLVAMVIVIFICYYLHRQRKKNNKRVSSPIMTDTELVILQEMPNGLTVQFNMSNNSVLQYNPEQYVSIKITREQIRLEKLLGSGAFGMVYQGKVKNLERPGIEIPAAIKMLRENASSQEKEMFLEEAKIMKYFRHKHVLRLLAICLDPEFPSIVLELMETDLLQYLRNNRKLQPSDSHALRLQDLFAICEDVARGCCYLEHLRFVHRDLACRNCLVSAGDRKNRVVKIGDFGLTRDIYNSDYYRQNGQGQLPVRWMAPESLVIGIFTSQSDVWSFGVVIWEITSLGEHPYTGRSNLDVIDYVRAGGRLPMPLNCPPTLYELILNCWSSSNDRPNFKLCLKNIITLRNNIKDTLLSPMDII